MSKFEAYLNKIHTTAANRTDIIDSKNSAYFNPPVSKKYTETRMQQHQQLYITNIDNTEFKCCERNEFNVLYTTNMCNITSLLN